MRRTPGPTSSVTSPESMEAAAVGTGKTLAVGDGDAPVVGSGDGEDDAACAGSRLRWFGEWPMTRKPPIRARMAPATAIFVALNISVNLHRVVVVAMDRAITVPSIRRPGPAIR